MSLRTFTANTACFRTFLERWAKRYEEFLRARGREIRTWAGHGDKRILLGQERARGKNEALSIPHSFTLSNSWFDLYNQFKNLNYPTLSPSIES